MRKKAIALILACLCIATCVCLTACDSNDYTVKEFSGQYSYAGEFALGTSSYDGNPAIGIVPDGRLCDISPNSVTYKQGGNVWEFDFNQDVYNKIREVFDFYSNGKIYLSKNELHFKHNDGTIVRFTFVENDGYVFMWHALNSDKLTSYEYSIQGIYDGRHNKGNTVLNLSVRVRIDDVNGRPIKLGIGLFYRH